jgi:ubiquinone/menaquinone biosynthesis C-methylase UbiE
MARGDKGYKGLAMEGAIARNYAAMTGKDLTRIEDEAGEVMRRAPTGARILEVAPGPGYLSIALARTGDYTVTGLDISQTFVEIAQRHAATAGVDVDFRHGNASAMPFEAGSFDFVVCCAAFKNFSEPARALQEMCRVLAPGGKALVMDLRPDVSRRAIAQEVTRMHLSPVQSVVTRMSLSALARRAHTKAEFEHYISTTGFHAFSIEETPISLNVEMRKL